MSVSNRDTPNNRANPSYISDPKKESPKFTAPVIGIVKSNVDKERTGAIYVYIASKGGGDPNNPQSWKKVRYLSPFMGAMTPGSQATGDGSYLGNPNSYGFWATAPELGTEVVCIFIDGDDKQGNGFYIGCVPKVGTLQMIPAIGSSSSVVPNAAEATTYGGADQLPTVEINTSNPSVAKSGNPSDNAKPVHSYQAAILAKQGLIRDKSRGTITSSAQRESPSRVFGMSTPGTEVFNGGYTRAQVASAVKNKADPSKLKAVGRTGGHTFVMDDGDKNGENQLVRLRTAAGHQIMMNDSEQSLFIIHSNGDSWIELGKEGTIDIYTNNSFNVRTEGDLNLHADRNVNIHAGKSINMYSAENLKLESGRNTTMRVGGSFQGYSAANYSFNIAGSMIMRADGKAGVESGGTVAIQGSKVNLNSGGSGLTAPEVEPIPQTCHVDATLSQTVGWIAPGPKELRSVTNRTPTHHPWLGAGKGVNK